MRVWWMRMAMLTAEVYHADLTLLSSRSRAPMRGGCRYARTASVRCEYTPRGTVARPAQPPVWICLGKPLPVVVFRPPNAPCGARQLSTLHPSSLCRRVSTADAASAPEGPDSGPVSPPHLPVKAVAGSTRPPRATRSLAAPILNNSWFLLGLRVSDFRAPLRDHVFHPN